MEVRLIPSYPLGQFRYLSFLKPPLTPPSLIHTQSPGPKKTCFHAILGLTPGISEPLGNSEMAGPLAVRGHGRAATADSTSASQVPDPANFSNLQPSPRSWPVALLRASRPALARLLAQVRLQLPGISPLPAAGLQEGTEPPLCQASLSPLLSGAEAPG